EIYTLSLHDALPILTCRARPVLAAAGAVRVFDIASGMRTDDMCARWGSFRFGWWRRSGWPPDRETGGLLPTSNSDRRAALQMPKTAGKWNDESSQQLSRT